MNESSHQQRNLYRMAKRARTADSKGFFRIRQREVGEVSPRIFAHSLAASENLVHSLDIYKKLEKHTGCVNTLSFNAYGDILVSGSDDRMVILWDWDVGRVKLSFHSGHTNNVFQAKIMPYTDDRVIITCAADGQVRHAQIAEHGQVETVMLAKHQGRAHKLAIEPGSPHIFYSCGDDGLVQNFDLRTGTARELFTCKSLNDKSNYMPIVHLNAIAIDPRNPNLFAVAGSDEYARLYDIRKYNWDGSTNFGQPTECFCPSSLIGDEQVGITGLAFSNHCELLVSYNDENIYLFTRDMGLGPNPIPLSPSGSDNGEMESDKAQPQVYEGHSNCDTMKDVNFFGPTSEYVVSGSDCGRLFIWRKKGGQLVQAVEADKHVVNCIEPHPYATMLASSGIESNIKIWTPNLNKSDSPRVKVKKSKPPRKSWLHGAPSTEELMLPFMPLQRQRSDSDYNEEDLMPNRELLELIMGFNGGNDDGSSDTEESDSSTPGDCVIN